MAELAIPLMVLGGMYVASNQENNKSKHKSNDNGISNLKNVNKEGLTNMTQIQNESPGVNHQLQPKNYPIDSKKVSNSNVSKYSNSNQHTDKYYDSNNFSNVEKNNSSYSVGGSAKQNYSLNGNPINTTEFKHNNMVPFLGQK